MSNLGRVLTLRVKITDAEAANWIWDNHLGKPSNGITVEAIANGDLFEPKEDVVEIAKKFYIREEGETTEESVDAHCYGGFDELTEAVISAPKNVDKGSKWDIIDVNGKVYASGVAE